LGKTTDGIRFGAKILLCDNFSYDALERMCEEFAEIFRTIWKFCYACTVDESRDESSETTNRVMMMKILPSRGRTKLWKKGWIESPKVKKKEVDRGNRKNC